MTARLQKEAEMSKLSRRSRFGFKSGGDNGVPLYMYGLCRSSEIKPVRVRVFLCFLAPEVKKNKTKNGTVDLRESMS